MNQHSEEAERARTNMEMARRLDSPMELTPDEIAVLDKLLAEVKLRREIQGRFSFALTDGSNSWSASKEMNRADQPWVGAQMILTRLRDGEGQWRRNPPA